MAQLFKIKRLCTLNSLAIVTLIITSASSSPVKTSSKSWPLMKNYDIWGVTEEKKNEIGHGKVKNHDLGTMKNVSRSSKGLFIFLMIIWQKEVHNFWQL